LIRTCGKRDTIYEGSETELLFDKQVSKYATFSCQICDKLSYISLTKVVSIGPILMEEFRKIDCNALPPELVRACSRCASNMAKAKVPPQAKIDSLSLAPVPKCISDLNQAELRLIPQVRPYMKIFMLNNGRGQRASKGIVIHFPMQVNKITKTLPVNPASSDKVIVRENISGIESNNEYRIRPKCVLSALSWLKDNNPLYRDINVDAEFNTNFMHRSVVSSNIRDTCREVSDSCINLGCVALSEGVFMLRGSFCQSHVVFGDSLGKQ
jgi:hypothetical protein